MPRKQLASKNKKYKNQSAECGLRGGGIIVRALVAPPPVSKTSAKPSVKVTRYATSSTLSVLYICSNVLKNFLSISCGMLDFCKM